MEKRNRYKNRIRPLLICRLILGGMLLLGVGAGFVLVRNQHVMEGDVLRSLEDEIVELDREIELWELRIAAVRDRQELSRRLRWVQSDLNDVDPGRVIEIHDRGAASAPMASAF